jgi:hypothetical protein
MKELQRVEDLSPEDIKGASYDLVMFCSGFEHRCTYVPRQFEADFRDGASIIVLGFTEDQEDESRIANDRFFVEHFGVKPVLLSGSADETVFTLLNQARWKVGEPARIFVDISSMSRVWYAAVINWARFSPILENVTVDFAYSEARYEQNYPHRVVSSIKAIPGCEGYPDPRGELLAIFGLGFDGISPLAVLDDLEPDDVLAFAAIGPDEVRVSELTRQANAGLLDLCRDYVGFPLGSVQQTYTGLLEMVSPHVGNKNVVIIPLGPKAHVLSSILVSVKTAEVACLHVAGPSARKMYAPPSGTVVFARSVFY